MSADELGALPMPMPVPVGPEPLSAERLAEIEARAEAATAGPWWTDTLTEHDGSESVGVDAEGDIWIVPCQDIDHADAEFMAHARVDVPALLAEVRRQAAHIAELEAQRERRRVRLVALSNDALSMRGSLSPMGEDRKVPFPLGETLTPAVDWLIGRIAELEAERHSTNEALDDAVQALRARPKTVFRASHDSIVMGLYDSREAAQAHCEAKVQEEEPEGSILHLSWSADDIGPDAEYELHITPTRTGGLIRGTGYVVTPVEVASAYDPDADE